MCRLDGRWACRSGSRLTLIYLPARMHIRTEKIPVNVNVDDAAVLKEAEVAAPGT